MSKNSNSSSGDEAGRPAAHRLPPRPVIPFTAERKERYLKALRDTGMLGLSAESIGITWKAVQDHRKSDAEFEDRVQEALRYHAEHHLMKALLHRGVRGVKKPLIGGKFRDQVVGHERVYSDACLLAIARVRLNELKEGGDEAASNVQPVMLVPAAVPSSAADWARQHGTAARGETGKPESKK